MDQYCTSDVPVPMRVAYWEEVASRTCTGLHIVPQAAGDYRSSMKMARLDGLGMARPLTEAVTLRHEASHISGQSSRAFLVHHQLSGTSCFAQGDQRTRVEAGDFVLTDTSRPYDFRLSDNNEMLVVRLPESAVSHWRHVADGLFGVTVSGRSPHGTLLASYLTTLWTLTARATVPVGAAKVALDLVEMAWTPMVAEQKSRQDVKRDAILEFIAAHLFDPDLSVGRIAVTLDVTPRCIQKRLSEINTTPSQYICAERLKAAARFLTDPGKHDLSVSDIAYLVGFSDLSHFSRSFKARFGQAPLAYRRGR